MIDNPLPDQVMAEKDQLHLQRNFEYLCKIHGVEIARHYKVHPDLHDEFAEWYHDYMSQNITCLNTTVSLQMTATYVTGGQTIVISMMTSFHLIGGLNSNET